MIYNRNNYDNAKARKKSKLEMTNRMKIKKLYSYCGYSSSARKKSLKSSFS